MHRTEKIRCNFHSWHKNLRNGNSLVWKIILTKIGCTVRPSPLSLFYSSPLVQWTECLYPPPNSYVAIYSFNTMVVGGGAFGRWLGHGGVLNGRSALIKETPERSLPLLPCNVTAKRWLSVRQESGSHHWVWQQLNFGLEFSHSVVSDSMRPHGLQHARLSYPSPTPRACSNSLSRWRHPAISSSVVPFSSCLQSFPASGSFFISGGQSIGTSASASVVPKNIQDWFPLGWTGWISLQSKGVFSNTTVQKYQFFSTQLSLWSNSHIHTWLLEKP